MKRHFTLGALFGEIKMWYSEVRACVCVFMCVDNFKDGKIRFMITLFMECICSLHHVRAVKCAQ